MKTITVNGWNGTEEITKSEYVKKFVSNLDGTFILVNYDDATTEERDGASYYIESESEEQYNLVVDTVTKMAQNEFERLYERQRKSA